MKQEWKAAPIWELIENAEAYKKMYLDGILNINDSPLTKYLKDRNKTIISADDPTDLINKLSMSRHALTIQKNVTERFQQMKYLNPENRKYVQSKSPDTKRTRLPPSS